MSSRITSYNVCYTKLLRGMGCGSRSGKMEMHNAGKPQVLTEKCIGCGRCVQVCAHDAPSIENRKCTIDLTKCVGCGRCIGACPVEAIRMMDSETNELLNKKISEYSQAVCQDRPHFHASLVITSYSIHYTKLYERI